MVVTVVAMRIVQTAVDDIAGVITVGHRLVATPRTVEVLRAVPILHGVVFVRVCLGHREHVLFNGAVLPLVVQVAVMHVVHVAVVLEAQVSTLWAVRMRMGFGMHCFHRCLSV